MLFSLFFRVFLLFFFCGVTDAASKCVWASGVVRCLAKPDVNVGLKVTMLDRDGKGLFQKVDRDDMMSFTVTEEDGTFQLSGCASDFNWFFRQNLPEPFIRIKHRCNSWPQTLDIKLKKVFAPFSQDVGLTLLDTGRQILDPDEMANILRQDSKVTETT